LRLVSVLLPLASSSLGSGSARLGSEELGYGTPTADGSCMLHKVPPYLVLFILFAVSILPRYFLKLLLLPSQVSGFFLVLYGRLLYHFGKNFLLFLCPSLASIQVAISIVQTISYHIVSLVKVFNQFIKI